MATAASRVARPERQNRLIFIGAVVLAAFAAVLVFLAVSGAADSGGGGSTPQGFVEVVVASQEIPAGTRITGSMLMKSTFPKDSVAVGALDSPEVLEGLVLQQSVSRGDQVTLAKAGQGDGEDGPGVGRAIPPGMRAMPVEVDEKTAVGGLIVPGDRVDVVLIRGDGDVPVANMLLQNVEVFAVGQEALEPTTSKDSNGETIDTDTANNEIATQPDDAEGDPEAETITLLVPPEDAALLALAQEQGTVWLSLRGSDDGVINPIGPQELE